MARPGSMWVHSKEQVFQIAYFVIFFDILSLEIYMHKTANLAKLLTIHCTVTNSLACI
jgi:hypothetical protein